MHRTSEPVVSVVLPSYNRAHFLTEALASIQSQTFADWELVIVDDGSTDDTQSVIERLSKETRHRVRYRYQPNQGPAAARNTGVEIANGRYIAFYDSDDLWLPHHLEKCVAALDANPEVDWVYGACRLVELGTGKEIQASSFYPGQRPHPFMSLETRRTGQLQIITDDRATECMLSDGLMCGLQCSVFRRPLLTAVPLPAQRCGEDQIFVVQVLHAGFRLAYLDDVHVIYRVHDDCVSARERDGAVDKAVHYVRETARSYEALPRQLVFTRDERRALHRRLANEYFWTLGYGLLWQNGRRDEALAAFRQGLRHAPWNMWLWKTYAAAMLRMTLSRDANL